MVIRYFYASIDLINSFVDIIFSFVHFRRHTDPKKIVDGRNADTADANLPNIVIYLR